MSTNSKTNTVDSGDRVMYRRTVDTFYSELHRAVKSAKQKKAPAQDWKNIIRRLPGVKKAEIEWTGIDEWLDLQGGNQVSREELETLVSSRQIEIIELTMSGEEPTEPDYSLELYDAVEPSDEFIKETAEEYYMDSAREYLEEQNEEYPSDEEILDKALEFANDSLVDSCSIFNARLVDNLGDGETFEGTYDTEMDALYIDDSRFQNDEGGPITKEQAIEIAYRIPLDAFHEFDGPATHESYTEHGGENYKELLLTIPNLHETGTNAIPSEKEAQMEAISREISELTSLSLTPDEFKINKERVTELRKKLEEFPDPKEPYSEDMHFEEPNIIVHLRVKERVDTQGRRILFVEEVQSDLASAHRENVEPQWVTDERESCLKTLEDSNSEIKRIVKSVQERLLAEFTDKYGQDKNWIDIEPDVYFEVFAKKALMTTTTRAHPSAAGGGMADWIFENVNQDRFKKDKEAVQDCAAEASIAEQRLLQLGTKKEYDPSLPNMPFEGKAIIALAAKHVLRYAAENEFDSVAWTPGYMQADRWNAAGQSVVNSVVWSPASDSSGKILKISMAEAGDFTAVTDENGIFTSAQMNKDVIVGKSLTTLFGPSLAKSIMNTPEGKTNGEAITFSDSGYAIVYDQQLPSAVNKIASKFGSKVEVINNITSLGAATENLRAQVGKLDFNLIKDRIEERHGKAAVQELETKVERARASREIELNQHIERLRSEIVLVRADPPKWCGDVEHLIREYERKMDSRRREISKLDIVYKATLKGELLRGVLDKDLGKVFPEITSHKPGKAIWAVQITPKLREAVMMPMPLFRRETTVYPRIDQSTLDAFMPILQEQLHDLGIHGVKLSVDATSPDAGRFTAKRNGDLEILIGQGLNPKATLNHEAIHVLRERSLFTDSEWNALRKQAKKEWIDTYKIEHFYPDFSEEHQIEEAIAEAFADPHRRPTTSTIVTRALSKISSVLTAITRAIGITRWDPTSNVEQVFSDIKDGIIGSRYAGPSQGDDERAAKYIKEGLATHEKDYSEYRISESETSLRIYNDGSLRFYQNGKLHAEDGPALISPGGHKVWSLNGKPTSESKVFELLRNRDQEGPSFSV